MTNMTKLKAAIRRERYSNRELANALGMNESTLYRKLDNDGKTFTIEEAGKLVNLLHLGIVEAHDIFFCE